MKNNPRSVATAIQFLCVVIFILSVASVQQQDPWNVPASYRNMKNPVIADSASISSGQILYKKHCVFCHGKTGLGDGVKARQLETFPGDMSSEAYQVQTDGVQFYKSKFGKDEMPSYEKILTDKEIWEIVNYLRTFKD